MLPESLGEVRQHVDKTTCLLAEGWCHRLDGISSPLRLDPCAMPGLACAVEREPGDRRLESSPSPVYEWRQCLSAREAGPIPNRWCGSCCNEIIEQPFMTVAA